MIIVKAVFWVLLIAITSRITYVVTTAVVDAILTWKSRSNESITAPPRYPSSEVEIIETADGYALQRVRDGAWWDECTFGWVAKKSWRTYESSLKAAKNRARHLECIEDREMLRKTFVEKKVWR